MLNFNDYATDGFYDELFDDKGQPRPSASPLINQVNKLTDKVLEQRQSAAESALMQMGITFSVYGDQAGTEKIMPFDILPRIIEGKEWDQVERGLQQRIEALNLFLQDIYNEGKIIRDGVVPAELIFNNAAFQAVCKNHTPSKGIWIHITGTDLIRSAEGVFHVLEDNLRCPSGVSYLLENREVLKSTFPTAFRSMKVRAVSNYSNQLLSTLEHINPNPTDNPNVVVLTPGPYNSAYFEHAYLAQQMGVPLVEGRDLVCKDDYVLMRTTQGFERVDVIYRRIDDAFIDPEVFNKDSCLGIPGIMQCYFKGNVALANAPGTGIADDKAVYAYTPAIIRYYLNQEPILPIIPTYLCSEEDQRKYVLDNIEKLVVKPVDLSGGYGMLVGPHSTKEEQDKFKTLIKAKPASYVAQPTISLSRSPVIVDEEIVGRHVDCRPYILYGKDINVMSGGLTRVALKKGSLVVNSSQGGGSKDTWIVDTKEVN